MGAKDKIIKSALEAVNGIRAYHGSPHKFDKFEWSPRTRGKGEGHQAYGDGLYFAGEEEVAKGYRDRLRKYSLSVGKNKFPYATPAADHIAGKTAEGAEAQIRYPVEHALANMERNDIGLDEAIRLMREDYPHFDQAKLDEAETLLRKARPKRGGHMYEVDINAEPGQLLDWFDPLSSQGDDARKAVMSFAEQRAEKMNAARKESLARGKDAFGRPYSPDKIAKMSEVADPTTFTGQGIYQLLQHELGGGIHPGDRAVEASQWLKERGVPGIKFLDQQSRLLKGGTNNYVIFDDNLIDVKRRYASGGIVKKLLGEVAREAPELAHGAAAAERRAVVNIGLDINGGERLAPEEALAAIERMGVKPVSARVAQSDSEPTLIIELERALKPDEAHELSVQLRQEAIAQVDEAGNGDLYGPMADNWKPFNGDFFIDPSGKRLTQAIMQSGDPSAVPGGVEPDPVLEKLDQIVAGLKGDEPAYAGGGAVKKVAGALMDAASALAPAAESKPMRLYHGRSYKEPIKQLDPTISPDQLGIHLGDPETAGRFATIRDNVRPKDAGARVIPLDVDLKNPLRLQDRYGKWEPEEIYRQLADSGLVQFDDLVADSLHLRSKGYVQDVDGSWVDEGSEEAKLDAMLEIQDMIRDLGHDGVVYTNRYEMPSEALARAQTRDPAELKRMSDEDFKKEFPEAVDSYIAFRNEQLKSPFGEGPGVGYAGGGVVRKIGAGLVDLLDFSGVAGKPKNVKIPGRGDVAAAPIKELDEAAEAYMRKHGIPGTHRIDQYPEFDEEFATRVAEYYDRAKHDPFDPAVKRAYDAQIEETLAQYAAAKDTGIDFRFLKEGEVDPYAASPSLGYADIVENGRMYTFPSDLGFGSNAAFDATQNPMLKRVGRIGDKPDAVANDAFRIIHDLYGHYGPGNPFFRPPGEERAWQHHARMFSDDALPAMTADTRGHTSWAGFHPSVREHNKTASSKDTIYADQKAVAFPDWAIEENLGRKLKKADGGPVRMANAGLVRKAVDAAADYLLPAAKGAGKQVRDDVVNSTALRGDGLKFKDFFADVTSGKSDKYKPSGLDNYDPAIQLGDDAAAFRMLRDHYSGSFDNHIKTSIPGFDEVQNSVGSALLKTYGRNGADVLDIGSSEGALIKALSNASEGRIRTTGVDPNPSMLETYRSKPQAPGSRSALAAFGSADDAGKVAWEEADGTPIPFFDPEGQQYDAAHEAMVFQFISNARRAQAERVKQLLKPKGIAIFEEKFGGPKAVFDANEAKKDLYKAKYYTPEQLEIKRKEVLNTGNDAVEGMTDLQVSQAEMERILTDTFKNRAQFWDSGNFKGYAASDDNRALEDFLNNLQSLDSEYANTKTPRGFADGGPVMSDEDIASMTHDKSYGTGRRPAYLETLGERIPIGETNYYVDPDGTEYAPGEEGPQFAHDIARLGIYAVPGVGPWIGAGLDTTEAIATHDPAMAVLAAGFGPGGKLAKATAAGVLSQTVDPAEAEAGVFGRLGKWAMSSEGKRALAEAERLSENGVDSGYIRDMTGWFKDTDGHWKYYRPSQGGSLDLSKGRGRLGDVLSDPHLFEEYPDMAGVGFRRKNSEGAHYDPGPDEIVLGDTSKPGYNTPEMGGKYGTVLHEVYHAKAQREGWPQGMSAADGIEKATADMKRFLGNKRGTDDFRTGLQISMEKSKNASNLSHHRYEAEIGEALARREALMREMPDELLRGLTPNDQRYIDTPFDALFRPGEPAKPSQYRALLKYMDDVRAAEDMQRVLENQKGRR